VDYVHELINSGSLDQCQARFLIGQHAKERKQDGSRSLELVLDSLMMSLFEGDLNEKMTAARYVHMFNMMTCEL